MSPRQAGRQAGNPTDLGLGRAVRHSCHDSRFILLLRHCLHVCVRLCVYVCAYLQSIVFHSNWAKNFLKCCSTFSSSSPFLSFWGLCRANLEKQALNLIYFSLFVDCCSCCCCFSCCARHELLLINFVLFHFRAATID